LQKKNTRVSVSVGFGKSAESAAFPTSLHGMIASHPRQMLLSLDPISSRLLSLDVISTFQLV
jgi:hypothetical protein